jgi:formate C-acetyltransferase
VAARVNAVRLLRLALPAMRSLTTAAPVSVPARTFATKAKKAKVVVAAKKPAPIDVPAFVTKQMAQLKLQFNGDSTFLSGPTEKTKKLWAQCEQLLAEELKKDGVLAVDPSTPSSIVSHAPGYINKDLEVIVGLQTDAPLKRAIKPAGGTKIVKDALEAFGYKLDSKVEQIFGNYRKTHNQGVFDAYTPEMRMARSVGILTGLPDAYGRGRIIGDYRRVALYGTDALIASKKWDHDHPTGPMTEETIRVTEEISEQMRALKELATMAKGYGLDVTKPAKNAQEAVQWLYFGYLASVKEQDGAAMSLGRVDAFLDSYIEKDIQAGVLTESSAQELIDQLIIKLRLVRHLRPPAYNALFAGDPTWVTMVLGGVDAKGEHMVTKTAFRILNTLYNLGPAPEPNITVLWHEKLPQGFKRFAAKASIDTSSIQYENDMLMGERFGSDYAIACCVSAMVMGKDMQFFGARCNLAKLMLYVLNCGVDELTGDQMGPKHLFPKLATTSAVKGGQDEKPLDFAEVRKNMEVGMEWLAKMYSETMNIIHFMHDKYNYERVQMALHDSKVRRWLAFGVAGLSVVADSLSAIKFAKVYPIRNEQGITTDFKVVGAFPKYGNDNDDVDSIAKDITESFSALLKKQPTYRNSIPTLSILTITSNVVYGEKTGTTPDGRKVGEAFAPGANPMHGRDESGCLASLNSVAKLNYDACRDGISNTFTIVPSALGKTELARQDNLVSILDGYINKQGFHLNVNVLNRDTLVDAMHHPEKYPQLTIRVSGYAVHFAKLSRKHQQEVISRTFHESF